VVEVAELEFTPGDWSKDAAALRYIAVRFTPVQGVLFTTPPSDAPASRGEQLELVSATPEVPTATKYLAVVTNRPQPPETPLEKAEPDHMTTQDAVRWHWGKAGTIEHVHYTLKDELGAGILPTQQFGGNAAWFRINALTYNVLTFLKRQALPSRFRTARPKRLRFELFELAGRLTFHQRQIDVDVSTEAKTIDELIAARGRLLAIYESRHGRAKALDA